MVFGNVYGFALWQRGICFLGLFVGMVFAILSDPIWRRIYARLEKRHERTEGKIDDPQPEWRLPPGMFFYPQFIYPWAIADYNLQLFLVVRLLPSASLSLPGRSIAMSTGSFLSSVVHFLEQGKHS